MFFNLMIFKNIPHSARIKKARRKEAMGKHDDLGKWNQEDLKFPHFVSEGSSQHSWLCDVVFASFFAINIRIKFRDIFLHDLLS